MQVTTSEAAAGWPAFSGPDRTWPGRGQARHQRRPRRSGHRDRRDPLRRRLATLPVALRREPGVRDPKDSWPWVKALSHSIYDQPDADTVHASSIASSTLWPTNSPPLQSTLKVPRRRLPLHFAFPKEIWRQIRSNKPNERLNREIRRRTDGGAMSPTAPGSSDSSDLSWPSNTTSGPLRPPLHRTRRPHPRPSRRHNHRRGGERARTPGPHGLTDTPNRGIPHTPPQRT